MKLVTLIVIDRPLAEVKALMADASNSTKWMHDLESYVPAEDGHDAQLAFKNRGTSMVFTVSPLPSSRPNELRSKLTGKDLAIVAVAHFKTIAALKTELRFEQEFTFKRMGKLLSFIARPAMQKQQQKHMRDFKYFVEDQSR
jgi:hypothetical protein